jgi:Caspase domain
MLVAMASDPGTEALDGNGQNSPYVEAFVKAIEKPTTPDIRAIFGQTRLEVRRSTNGQQSSWLFGAMGQEDVDMGFRREPLKR